jgi:hypothetical protein
LNKLSIPKKFYALEFCKLVVLKFLGLLGLTEIKIALKEDWGGLDLAHRKLWKPIILSLLRNGDHSEKILIDFGYTKNTAKSQYNRVLKRLFNGMTYTQIKEKIKNSRNY